MNVFSRLDLRLTPILGLLTFSVLCCGCGTMLSQSATEHLLLSDAVDRSVSKIDFRALSGEKVFFDTQYIRAVKGVGFVNADYFISSLRQQMAAAHCLLQDKREDADYVVEARIGVLGTNSHDVTYGLPQNTSVTTALNTAAAVMPAMPAIPPLPELSLAKKHDQTAAAKVALFAYNLKTKQPVWQSGISLASSNASDTWIFGAGPFQRGSIYNGTSFASSKVGFRWPWREQQPQQSTIPVVYKDEHIFTRSAHVPPPTGDQSAKSQSRNDDPGEVEPATAKPAEKRGESPLSPELAPSVFDDQQLLWQGPELLIERAAPATQKR